MSAHQPIKVAIADNHKVYKQGIEKMAGYYSDIHLVIQAENRPDLLHHDQNKTPGAILLDLRMPVMDGIETLAKLKMVCPSIKVIDLTINIESQLIFEVCKLEKNAYLLRNSRPGLSLELFASV